MLTRTLRHAILLLVAVILATAASDRPALASTSGGATAPSTPVISDVICSSGCLGLRKATVGSTVQISGRNLEFVRRVSFASSGKRILSPVSSASANTVLVTVPAGARSGGLRARDDYGSVSRISEKLAVLSAQPLTVATSLRVLEAEISPRKAYFFGARNPSLSFVITSPKPANDLRVDVIKGSDGQIVRSFFLKAVAPGTTARVRWNGLDTGGAPAPGGAYSFRIKTLGGAEASLSRRLKRNSSAGISSPRETTGLGFELRPFIFPVEGKVRWGDGIGAGRGHQGQDLLTTCGKKLYAARGGTVVFKGTMSGAAGNYVVISAKSSRLDFAYMHLMDPVSFELGDTVRTGQRIGRVGATGRASACHLHFEAWGAPGWYRGGSPVSPTAMLRKWYRQ